MEIPQDCIQLFPTIEDVFENPTAMHKAIFFPLMSIDLASIDKGTGKAHIIVVYGNGDPEIDYPSDKAGYNFIKFKIKGEKYEFEGDLKSLPMSDKALEWYQEAEETYTTQKEQFLTQSEFARYEKNRRKNIDFDYDLYIDGVINYWVTRDKYLETGKFIQGNAYTYGYSEKERPKIDTIGELNEEDSEDLGESLFYDFKIDIKNLDFIARLTPFNYTDLGEDDIALFIDRQNNEIFQYSDWS
jgi:hypothetical protein